MAGFNHGFTRITRMIIGGTTASSFTGFPIIGTFAFFSRPFAVNKLQCSENSSCESCYTGQISSKVWESRRAPAVRFSMLEIFFQILKAGFPTDRQDACPTLLKKPRRGPGLVRGSRAFYSAAVMLQLWMEMVTWSAGDLPNLKSLAVERRLAKVSNWFPSVLPPE